MWLLWPSTVWITCPVFASQTAKELSALMLDEPMRRRFGRHGHDSMQRFAPDQVVQRWEREFRLLDL